MMLEGMAQTLILVHAVLGGLALLLGAIALAAKKGKTLHKRAGKGFYYSMLATAGTALVVSMLPNHESPFLFSIGVFSSYFVISGFRSIRFGLKEFNLAMDRWLAYAITTTGVIMILYPLVLEGQLNVVLLTFGTVAIVIGVRDVVLFQDRTRLRKGWLKLHLGKMVGAYIAAVTAFFRSQSDLARIVQLVCARHRRRHLYCLLVQEIGAKALTPPRTARSPPARRRCRAGSPLNPADRGRPEARAARTPSPRSATRLLRSRRRPGA